MVLMTFRKSWLKTKSTDFNWDGEKIQKSQYNLLLVKE